MSVNKRPLWYVEQALKDMAVYHILIAVFCDVYQISDGMFINSQMNSCLGGTLRVELIAKSSFIGCLSTIIVFMLVPVSSSADPPPRLASKNPTPSVAALPDRQGSGDFSSKSTRPPVTQRPGRGTAAVNASYVIRRVKVYFQDAQMAAELRPTMPFRRPPRVSGKRAALQVEGLPLERWAILAVYGYFDNDWSMTSQHQVVMSVLCGIFKKNMRTA